MSTKYSYVLIIYNLYFVEKMVQVNKQISVIIFHVYIIFTFDAIRTFENSRDFRPSGSNAFGEKKQDLGVEIPEWAQELFRKNTLNKIHSCKSEV